MMIENKLGILGKLQNNSSQDLDKKGLKFKNFKNQYLKIGLQFP